MKLRQYIPLRARDLEARLTQNWESMYLSGSGTKRLDQYRAERVRITPGQGPRGSIGTEPREYIPLRARDLETRSVPSQESTYHSRLGTQRFDEHKGGRVHTSLRWGSKCLIGMKLRKYLSESRARRLDRHKVERVCTFSSQGPEGSIGIEPGVYVPFRAKTQRLNQHRIGRVCSSSSQGLRDLIRTESKRVHTSLGQKFRCLIDIESGECIPLQAKDPQIRSARSQENKYLFSSKTRRLVQYRVRKRSVSPGQTLKRRPQ